MTIEEQIEIMDRFGIPAPKYGGLDFTLFGRPCNVSIAFPGWRLTFFYRSYPINTGVRAAWHLATTCEIDGQILVVRFHMDSKLTPSLDIVVRKYTSDALSGPDALLGRRLFHEAEPLFLDFLRDHFSIPGKSP